MKGNLLLRDGSGYRVFSGQLQVDVTLSDALDPAVTVEIEYLDNRDIA